MFFHPPAPFDSLGDLPCAGLVGLGGSEHDHEERKQQRDEIRIGDQPAFMVFVRNSFFRLAMEVNQPERLGPPPRQDPALDFFAAPLSGRNASSFTRISFGFIPSTILITPSSMSSLAERRYGFWL